MMRVYPRLLETSVSKWRSRPAFFPPLADWSVRIVGLPIGVCLVATPRPLKCPRKLSACGRCIDRGLEGIADNAHTATVTCPRGHLPLSRIKDNLTRALSIVDAPLASYRMTKDGPEYR